MKNLLQIGSLFVRLAPAASLYAVLACIAVSASAGPGAHGPNGEHLDANNAGSVQGNSSPRVEAKSESFELVGRVEDGALSILIDKFDTNEPVLGANVEVEAGALKAKAQFRQSQGDYVVTDSAMLKQLAEPKKHALIFTISAGTESDLLEGALFPGSSAAAHDGDHAHGISFGSKVSAAIVALVIVALGVFAWRRRLARRSPYRASGEFK